MPPLRCPEGGRLPPQAAEQWRSSGGALFEAVAEGDLASINRLVEQGLNLDNVFDDVSAALPVTPFPLCSRRPCRY